jgi:hypothetical protein
MDSVLKEVSAHLMSLLSAHALLTPAICLLALLGVAFLINILRGQEASKGKCSAEIQKIEEEAKAQRIQNLEKFREKESDLTEVEKELQDCILSLNDAIKSTSTCLDAAGKKEIRTKRHQACGIFFNKLIPAQVNKLEQAQITFSDSPVKLRSMVWSLAFKHLRFIEVMIRRLNFDSNPEILNAINEPNRTIELATVEAHFSFVWQNLRIWSVFGYVSVLQYKYKFLKQGPVPYSTGVLLKHLIGMEQC